LYRRHSLVLYLSSFPSFFSIPSASIQGLQTDTKCVRDAILRDVMPVLRAYGQERGVEFQMVDMWWGMTEAATNEHDTTRLCLAEIEHSARISASIFFVLLQGHKYGFRPFPVSIPLSEWTLLRAQITDPAVNAALDARFKLDANTCPPAAVLNPVAADDATFWTQPSPGPSAPC
jgi:hypothetical protein